MKFEYVDNSFPSGLEEAENIKTKEAIKVEDIVKNTPKTVAIFQILPNSKSNKNFPHWIDFEDGEKVYFPKGDISHIVSVNRKFKSFNSGAYYNNKKDSIFPYLKFIGYQEIKE